jgi:hypothetical protein
MYQYVVLGSLFITFILTVLISAFVRRPSKELGLLFIIVFLVTWSSHLWIRPFGPNVLGVSWVPMLVVALFFWILILTLQPPLPKSDGVFSTEEVTITAASGFFWMLLILLILFIVLGYYRLLQSPPINAAYRNLPVDFRAFPFLTSVIKHSPFF